MQPFPHHYVVVSSGTADGDVHLSSGPLPVLRSAPPTEFDGPGTRWSPETLLVAAASDCFILTFRAIARASNLVWTSLECEMRGTLDRVDGTTQFTRFDLHAWLTIPAETQPEQARRLLAKAERSCLIANSLKAERALTVDVEVARSSRAALG